MQARGVAPGGGFRGWIRVIDRTDAEPPLSDAQRRFQGFEYTRALGIAGTKTILDDLERGLVLRAAGCASLTPDALCRAGGRLRGGNRGRSRHLIEAGVALFAQEIADLG